MSLREAAEAILKSVEGEMSSAYNRAHAVCCGRGIDECCGSPEPEWDEADQLVMNTLASIQNALRAALAEAEAPKAEPVGDDPSLDPMIANAWDRFTAALDEAPMTDEEILALWQPPLEGAVQRPILGKNKILAFARAVLAHGRKR